MGGKALKIAETERKTTKQFNQIVNEIVPIIQNKLGTEVHVVKCYREKETHGDLDLLLRIDHKFHNKGINLKTFVKDTFDPTEIFSNGSVISFDYDKFQIDLIPVKESNWEASRDFFDQDPTGNLMGKIAKKFGLKYGFEGLVFPYRSQTGSVYGNITISKDSQHIFEFLGFDYNRYLQGFDTLEEIFEYVINSYWFKSKYFKMDQLTSIDRKRNKRRESYQKFLKYVHKRRFKLFFKTIFNNLPKYKEHKELFHDIIDKNFPEVKFKQKLQEFKKKELEHRIINSKFNGSIVMEKYPELKGKELGQIMGSFKKDKKREYFLNNTKERILNDFNNFYLDGRKNKNT